MVKYGSTTFRAILTALTFVANLIFLTIGFSFLFSLIIKGESEAGFGGMIVIFYILIATLAGSIYSALFLPSKIISALNENKSKFWLEILLTEVIAFGFGFVVVAIWFIISNFLLF